MSNVVRFAAVILATAPIAAQAQWVPQWLATAQHPESFHDASVQRLRVDDDGVTFAAIDVTHHSRSHAALARVEPDGTFAWLREHETLGVAAIERMPGGRIALVAPSATAGATIDVRVYDGASGDVVWSRTSNVARLDHDERYETRHLDIDANGNLFIAASDGDDFVVLRYAANGDALPAWRSDAGTDSVAATAILALADGGAIVSGQGDSVDGGFHTVRFDASGTVLFDDVELGEIGNPLGPSFLARTPDGGILVAAAPESTFGVPKAMVWKLSADGTRAWATVLPNPGAPNSFEVAGLIATPEGDALVVVEAVLDLRFRLMRIRGSDGVVMHHAQAAIGGNATTFALAPNGRILVGGYAFGSPGGGVAARIAEFDANGAPCRTATNLGMLSPIAAIGATGGWTIGGSGPFVQNVGADVLLRRYDADGACTDAIFGNGFDTGR